MSRGECLEQYQPSRMEAVMEEVIRQGIMEIADAPYVQARQRLAIRKAHLALEYEGLSADAVIGTIEQFTYTDQAEGKSDSISLKIDNIDRRWQNGWIPKPYDRLVPTLHFTGADGKESYFRCGEFYADDFSITGGPLTVQIGAVSNPVQYGFSNTQRSKTWQNVTVGQIAAEIASKYGLAVAFDASDSAAIESVEQSRETDAAFLKQVCDEHGFKLKIYSNRLVIYEISAYEDAAAVVILHPEDVVSGWKWNTSAQGTYTGATLDYTKGNGDAGISVSVGGGDRILSLNKSCDSEAEALKMACDEVNDKNRELTTMSITLKEPLFLSSTQVVALAGFGTAIDGRYFLRSVNMRMGGNGGLTVALQMYMIQQRIAS